VPILLINATIFTIVKREKAWSNKIINKISSCSLGIYLIHENKILVASGFYEWIHGLWAERMPVGIEFLLTAGVVFLIALFIEFAREKVLGGVFSKLCDFIVARILEPGIGKVNLKFHLCEK
jgi:surface polysaccharide O-acyltransferase-like enzyme